MVVKAGIAALVVVVAELLATEQTAAKGAMVEQV
jgi:hypothetical protein